MSHDSFTFMNRDICTPLNIDEDISDIYNLACPASTVAYRSSPIETIKASILGGLNLLELAKNKGSKILQSSTSEIYGDPLQHPQTEEYWGNVNPIGPRSCYDEGKRCAESLFINYYREYNTDVRVVRLFNTYGPNMSENDGRVISNFIVQSLNNQNVTIYGDGTQTRSFCYVDDMTDALIKVMDSSCHEPINLGNPIEYTVGELSDLIIKITGSASKKIYKNLPTDDPCCRKPDISKAINELQWQPTTTIAEGLTKTINYFKLTLESET